MVVLAGAMGAVSMADTPSWTDPSTWVGAGGALAVLGAAIKAVLDARRDRGQQRVTSEDLVREDLLTVTKEQRAELVMLRAELAAARVEMRQQNDQHWNAIRASEERADRFLDELRKLHSENDAVRSRYHRLLNYVTEVTHLVDVDRIERGLPPLPIPAWVDETIPRTQPPEHS